jgi:hypothetical protein
MPDWLEALYKHIRDENNEPEASRERERIARLITFGVIDHKDLNR